MSARDLVFVHEGNGVDPATPICLVPMGLLSMADRLDRNGVRVEIVHHGIERALDPGFDIGAYVARSGARLVCLDLHWHQQSRSVIALARRLRESCPDALIVLGGYTASAFAGQILERFPFVDMIVRGDAEIPVERLARAIGGEGRLDDVPNLIRGSEHGIAASVGLHVNSESDLGSFVFSRFELMRHAEVYNQAGVMEGRLSTGGERKPGTFYCNIGRGCPYDCLFCGGSRRSQELIAGRKATATRPLEAHVRDLSSMQRHGLDTWYNTFQPPSSEPLFHDLFGMIREKGLGISMIQECLHLPSPALVDDFARTFGPKSRMDFVLLSGSDDLRRRNKENYFSTADLLDTLDLLDDRGIAADLCFLTGLPHEDPESVSRSVDLARKVTARHPGVQVNAEVLAIEPMSPMNLDPDSCGIRSRARTFMDYHDGHATAGFVGYEPAGCDAGEACRRAKAIREAGRRTGGGERRRLRPGGGMRGPEGKRVVQLHDITLWDDLMRRTYGLGVPTLIAHARSVPGIDREYEFEHVGWRTGPAAADLPDPVEMARRVTEASPVLAGFTLVTWSERRFLDAIRIVKRERPDIRIAVGGPLATGHGPSLMRRVPEIDYLVSGYGELAFAGVLEAIASGTEPSSAPGLHFRRGRSIVSVPQDTGAVLPPHAIPSPFREGLVDLSGCRTMHVEWSRGCRFGCAYCSWANALGSMKLASRERMLDDIAVAREHGIREIHVNNSSLNPDAETLAEVCAAMAEGGRAGDVRFTVFLRHETIDDAQLKMLEKVPLGIVYVGLQTDDPRGLRTIGRPRLDRDRFEWVVRALGRMSRPGVQVIMGLPGDTPDKFRRRLDWLVGLGCDVDVFPLQVTPGSRLERRKKQLDISPDPDFEYYVFRTADMTPADILGCAEHAARVLTPARGLAETRPSHGIPASPAFWNGARHWVERTGRGDAARSAGTGRPVFLHQAFTCCPYAAIVTARIHDFFEMNGRPITDDPGEASLCVINTCGFNASRSEQAVKAIGAVRRRSPGSRIVVSGCLTRIERERVAAALDGAPGSSMIGPGEHDSFDGLVEEPAIRFGDVPANLYKDRYSSGDPRLGLFQILVSTGCLGRCSYCVIRRAKGAIASRSLDDIAAEVVRAASQGHLEVFLVGDDISSWGADLGLDVSSLLGRVLDADPGMRFSAEAFEPSRLIERLDDLLPHFATGRFSWMVLPVQSGSDRILAAMERRYSCRDVREAVARLKAAAPGMIISTDFIYGFAGETEAEFEESLSLSSIFDYSNFNDYEPRPGTPPLQVEPDVMKARRERVKAFLRQQGGQVKVLARGRSAACATASDAGSPMVGRREPTRWALESVRRVDALVSAGGRDLGAGWIIDRLEPDGDEVRILARCGEEDRSMVLSLAKRDAAAACMAHSDDFNLILVSSVAVDGLDPGRSAAIGSIVERLGMRG